jgi:hypothetical protein
MLTTGALAGPVPRLTTQRRRRLGHYTGYARRYWRRRGLRNSYPPERNAVRAAELEHDGAGDRTAARPALGVADARAVPQRDGNIAGLGLTALSRCCNAVRSVGGAPRFAFG